MGSWRLVAMSLAPLLPPAAMVLVAEPGEALPAIGAALGLLIVSALAVDHFELALALRRAALGRAARDRRVAWRRARQLWRRFRAERDAGAPAAEKTARLLLVALGGCGRLDDAGEVVAFLAGEEGRRPPLTVPPRRPEPPAGGPYR